MRDFALRSALLLALAGCTVGPDFRPPADPLTPEEGTDGRWWDSFQDAELSSLVRRLLERNLDLSAAAERVRQARAQRMIAGSAGLPSVDVNGRYARERLSPQGPLSLVEGAPGAPYETDEWSDSLSSSWDLDLFGRVRRAVEAASARTDMMVEARHAVALSALAELAGDYMDLRGVQAREEIASHNLATAQHTLSVVEDRVSSGLGSRLDLARAKGQEAAISARLPMLHARRIQLIDAIGILIAAQPRDLEPELAPPGALPDVPPAMSPLGVPAQLLRRRPDIREAEAALHAATAETGVAIASFYPDISLTGRFGMDSLGIGTVWDFASRAFSFGPTVSLPLFEGGRLEGNLEFSQARQREAALQYRRTVILALNETDAALAAYADVRVRRDRLADEVRQDRAALAIAEDNYREGTVGLLSVTTAQTTLLEGEDELAESETAIRRDLVALYKSLGGGWDAADLALASGQEISNEAR